MSPNCEKLMLRIVTLPFMKSALRVKRIEERTDSYHPQSVIAYEYERKSLTQITFISSFVNPITSANV